MDVKALLRISTLYQTATAINKKTANLLLKAAMSDELNDANERACA